MNPMSPRKNIRFVSRRAACSLFVMLLAAGSLLGPAVHAVAHFSTEKSTIAVDNPFIIYSDYIKKEEISSAVGVDQKAIRFNRIRNLTTGKRYGWDTPGVRISFRTDARSVVAHLHYSTNHISTSARNGKGIFFINGQTQESWTFRSSSSTVVRPPELVFVELPSPDEIGFHDYEIILPYGDSVEFCGLEVDANARFKRFHSPRTLRCLTYGDSVTQGFSASRVDKTYPFLLGENKQWKILNMGMAGRASTASDGVAIGSLKADVVILLMGVNDWQTGVSLDRYRTQMTGLLSALRSSQPDVSIYLITPLWVAPTWTPSGVAFELEEYRTVLRDIAVQQGDPNLQIIEGPSLIDPENSYFDSVAVHPNDAGFSMMAQRLSTILDQPK